MSPFSHHHHHTYLLRALRPSSLLLRRQPLHPLPSSSSSMITISKPQTPPPFPTQSTSHRSFHSSTPLLASSPATATTAPPPIKKPIGAFRSGFFGFLMGATLAGAATWFYIMEEYRVSNELLTEDIYALQAAVQRIHTLVLTMEERLVLAEMKGGGKK